MQVPYRKPGKFSSQLQDPNVSELKYSEMAEKVDRLKKRRPALAAEVARLAELGDFSENAEYQLAKGRLRGLNNEILRLESLLNRAVIIKPVQGSKVIQLGSIVTVEREGRQKIFHILGPSETNPGGGVISHQSPLGQALLGHRTGEIVRVKIAERESKYKIILVENE